MVLTKSDSWLGSVLVQRLLTSLVLVPLVVLAIFFLSNTLFALLTWLILMLAAWEWSLWGGCEQKRQRLLFLVKSSVVLAFFSLLSADTLYFISFSWWTLASILVLCYPNGATVWGKPWIIGLMGYMTLSLTWYALVDLQSTEHGSRLVLFIMCIVWGADTGAYFSGKRWGKRKLAPQVSPGKSVAGFLGGVAVSVGFTLLVLLELDLLLSDKLFYLFFTLLTVIASVVGDLFESMLKRYSQVKDSGSILPGHGGVLDRVDSLTAAVPVFTAGLYFSGAFV